MNVMIARELLANMPDEVFNLYIEPLIQLHGWPFDSLDTSYDTAEKRRWFYMFDGHRLQTISELSWEPDKMAFALAEFHPIAQRTIFGLLDQHVRGIPTAYADVINTKARFASCRAFIASAKRMPKPVVLLQEWEGLRILDGNHRLAAMASLPDANECIVDCWIGIHYP